jgi:hypothetical protein
LRRGFIAGCLGLADLLRRRIAPCLQVLKTLHMGAALVVKRDQLLRDRVRAAFCQRLVEPIRIVPDPLHIQHL